MNIAKTTLSSKILSQHKDFFSELAVDAVLRYSQGANTGFLFASVGWVGYNSNYCLKTHSLRGFCGAF